MDVDNVAFCSLQRHLTSRSFNAATAGMPKAQDLTNSLYNLQGLSPVPTPPAKPRERAERRLSLNSFGWICWLTVATGLTAQLLFIVWIGRYA